MARFGDPKWYRTFCFRGSRRCAIRPKDRACIRARHRSSKAPTRNPPGLARYNDSGALAPRRQSRPIRLVRRRLTRTISQINRTCSRAKRVHEQGIREVWEIAPGRGRKAHYDQGQRDRIIQATLQSKPKGMTHWSCRLMAKAQGVSKNTVNRLWQLHNIKPHLSRTFKLSRDAKFLEKLTDVVGLYMNPPDKALVLCV